MRNLCRTAWAAALMIGAAGCGGPPAWKKLSVYEQLQHDDPAARLWGVVQVGRARDPKGLPYLVDRLTDSESEVRMFAIVSLRKITGQTLGYRYRDLPTVRAKSVARWREWLRRRAGGGSAGGKKDADRKT